MRLIFTIAACALTVSCASKSTKTMSEGKNDMKEAVEKVEKKAEQMAKKAEPLKSANGYTCQIGDIKREIRNVETSTGCKVEYTKDGSTQEIATGAPNSSHCSEVAERVKNNLATAGYNCD